MSLRKIYYLLSPNLRFFVRKLYYFPTDILDLILNKRRKYIPSKGDIFIGSGDFIKQGKHHLELLEKHVALKPNDSILDIGSGIGRTAVALTKFLSTKGKYEGFDVVEKGVNWCNNKIKKDFQNFNFTYVSLSNDLYNSSEKKATDFKFPYSKNYFDKCYLFSVFTHMQIDEIQNYLNEIERTLKPNGKCLATFFIYEIYTSLMNDRFDFPIKMDGYRLMSDKVKSANIAIEKSKLDKMISISNLKTTNYIEGYWKDSELKNIDNDFQDILILEKKGSSFITHSYKYKS